MLFVMRPVSVLLASILHHTIRTQRICHLPRTIVGHDMSSSRPRQAHSNIPLQNVQVSAAFTASNQNDWHIPSPPAPPTGQTAPGRILILTNTALTIAALTIAIVFGIGAWLGQIYGNKYTRISYELSLWGLCADHQVRSCSSGWIINPNPMCRVFSRARSV